MTLRRSKKPNAQLLHSVFLSFFFVTCCGILGCTQLNRFWNDNRLFEGTSSQKIEQASKEALVQVPTNDLCAAYHNHLNANIRDEISRRGLIESDQRSDIHRNEVWKGMTYCQIFASLGKPKETKLKSETTELVYGKTIYVFKNSELDGWFNSSEPNGTLS